MSIDWRESVVNDMWRALTRHAPETFGDPAPDCMVRPTIDHDAWPSLVGAPYVWPDMLDDGRPGGMFEKWLNVIGHNKGRP